MLKYERFPCYGNKTKAHAARYPDGGWTVWMIGRGCVATGVTMQAARVMLRSVGVPWDHIDGPEVDA